MKEIVAILLLYGLGAANSSAFAAVLPYAISPAEMQRLPSYCAVRMQTPWDSPESRAWRARIGENYGGFFHYCHALNAVNRYWAARSVRERSFYLEQALSDFSYIVNSLKPDFTMGAELFTHRGEVFKLMGKPGEAIRDLTQAISIDPTFVKAYLQLADLYFGNKDRGRALAIVSDGLRHAPGSTALQRRYLELGGKEPFPEPIVNRVVEKAPEPAVLPEPQPATSPVEVPSEPPTQTQATPVIGTPQNPYCRFCPPD